MSTATSTSYSLDVAGARLHYEVRGAGPVLLFIGAPMGSAGFGQIAPLLAEQHTVVTFDPRGIGRSTRDDITRDSTPEVLAEDVHQLLWALGDEPALVFGSSGGAVTGLALVAMYPDQVSTFVAHEPPLIELLPDHARLRTGFDDVFTTNLTEGPVTAMAKFFALVGFQAQGGPDRSAAAQARDDYFLRHMAGPITRFRPDFDALRAAPTRIVVGGGATSKGQIAQRSAAAFAERLGTGLVDFPGDHIGFVLEAKPFANVLREVLVES